MSETQNTTTTTTDLSAFEVVEICKQMGLRQTGHALERMVWEIAGYQIVGNNVTGDYTIEIDGDVLVEGNGGIVDALRDFLTAEA